MQFNYPILESTNVSGLRVYKTPNGDYYPSITTILGKTESEEKKVSLKRWQESLGVTAAQKVTRDAAERGTLVHTLIERYLKKEKLVEDNENIPQPILNLFNALKLKLNKIEEVWCLEAALYSDSLGVAGRTDCVGVYGGKESIIDFKTSTRIKNNKDIEDYKHQLCAYAIMHNEMFGTNIEHGVILMTSASGFPQEFNINLLNYIEPLFNRVELFYSKL